MPYSLNVQIAEVEREIKMRREVYPGLVIKRRMHRAQADAAIAIMEEVLNSLLELNRIKHNQGPQR